MKQLIMSALILGFLPFASLFAQIPDNPILSLSADSLDLEDGTQVKTWKSAEGLEMSVPGATLRGKTIAPPIFSANGMAGCPAVFFKTEDGVPSGLTLRDFAKNRLADSSFTIALLMQAVNTGFGICGTNPNGDGGVPRLYATNITFTYDKLENAIAFKDVFEKPVSLIFEYDKDKQTAKVFRDGKLIGEKSDISPVNTFGSGWLTIPFQCAEQPRSGYVAKLLVFNRVLPDTERQNLELEFNKYLKLKKKVTWGAKDRQLHQPTANAAIRYDGGSDPVAAGWKKTETAGMKITWNDPEENLATLDDTVMNPAGGAYLQIYHPLDGKPIAAQEYEYSIRMAVSNAKMLDYSGVAAMPLITGGLLDEGGGKRILLSWYTPDKLTRLLAFSTHASNGGPALPISFMNFNDGKFHTYTVKKYSDKKDGRFKIQVLIDGQAQLNPAADYEGFPDAQNDKYGLVLQTTSPAQATIVLEEFAFGPLNGVPAMPDKSALAISAAVPPRLLSPKWSSVESINTLCSDFIPVTGNRNYTLSGKFSGKNAAKLVIEQYQTNYPEADPVKIVIPLEPDKQFSQDFYLKYWMYKIKFQLTGANSSDISSLNLSGGGAYVPETRLPVPEKVPTLADTAAIIAKQPPQGFQRLAVPGAPKLLLNGESTGIVFHKGPLISQAPDKIGFYGMFREYGILKQEVTAISMPTPGLAAFWAGRDQYDFKVVDVALERMARSVPDGTWVIDLAVDPYVGWGAEDPEDVTQNQFGQSGYGMHHLLGWGEKQAQTRYLPSVFSQKVKDDITIMLNKLIPYIENGPYGKMVGGYFITGFNDADFGHWGLPGRKELDDYSPAALAAFRKFLRRKYGNEAERLQKSWENSQVNFSSALIPSEARRRGVSSQYMPWIDWSTHQDVADYRECYVEATGDLAESACRTVREIIGDRKTIHTWAGTPMHGWFYSSAGFKRFLQNPSWDVSVSPMDYNIRLPGYPGGCDTVIDSVSLHGKLFLTEQDWRSIAAPTQFENMDFANGRMPSAATLRNGIRRESGMMIAHGQGTHFLDHSNGHYALPELMDGVREAAQVFEKAAKVKERPEADVAIFIGEDSSLYLSDTLESQVYWMRLTRRQRPEWDTSGVPYHLYLQDDLTHDKLPDYKVYIFIAPEFLEEKTRRRIEELKRDGKVLVFLHAPGMVGSADPDAAIAQITGMQVRLIPEVTTYAANWEKGSNALLENLSGRFGDRPYSFPHASGPAKGCAFEIIDPSATVLAKFCANNKPAVAYRDFGTWKSVFMAIPCVDAQFMNNLAKLAGAWVAAASHDAVYANQNFLTVHAQSPGKKTLKLRYPSKVSDAITGEVIADNVSEFSVEMTFGQTRIFRTESNLPIRP